MNLAGRAGDSQLPGMAVKLFSLLIVVMLAGAVTLDQQSKNLIKILSIAGLLIALIDWRASLQQLKQLDRRLVSLLLLFFASALLSVAANQMYGDTARNLEKLGVSVGVVFIWLLLIKSRFQAGYFWWALILCAIGSGIYAVGEILAYGFSHRADGSTGRPIMFGDVALISGLMAAMSWRYFSRYRWRIVRVLPLLALAMGILASLLSGSRGGWIFLPAVAVLLFWYLRPQIKVWRWKYIAVAVITTGLIIGASWPIVENRIIEVENDLAAYRDDRSSAGGTSIGARMEMWGAAVEGARESPLFGLGVGGVEPFLKRLAEAGRINPHIANKYQDDGKWRGFSHVHNEFLNSLMTRGWFGLLVVILLFLVTSLLFFRIAALRRAPESDIAFAGLLLVVGYAHFALTESVLIHPVTLNFFLTSLVTVAYLTRSKNYWLTGRGEAVG